MRTLLIILGAAVIFLHSSWLAPVAAQGEQGQSAQQPGSERLAPDKEPAPELVYERELFAYPVFRRRNPFQPPSAPKSDGLRFEEIRLLGIIHHRDARYSVVLLGTNGGGNGVADAPGPRTGIRTFRVRLGDALGNVRIVEIHESGIVVEVEVSGGPVRRMLQLPRAAERSVP